MAASAPKPPTPSSKKARWLTPWQSIKAGLSLDHLTQRVLNWFVVDDAQVARILEQVRSELPTTEAWLIGKPQSGKSSVVRGLTGVSADIIGQGFRPHTQHTQRYAYPSEDLPLL